MVSCRMDCCASGHEVKSHVRRKMSCKCEIPSEMMEWAYGIRTCGVVVGEGS